MTRQQTSSPRPSGGQLAPLLVTVPEAARILSIGRTALYQLVWSGDLTPIHIGRSVRFPIEELQDFIERRIASEVGRASP